MPVSNGQVSRYDIRRDAVHTNHIIAEAVITEKVVDQAITDDKIDNLQWQFAVEAAPFINPTLTTTETEQTSVSIDIPTDINQISILAFANCQMSNSSGGDQNLTAQARVNGDNSGNRSHTIINGDLGSVDHVTAVNLAGVAGTTITVEAWAWVHTGTNSANSGTCWAMVVGSRD